LKTESTTLLLWLERASKITFGSALRTYRAAQKALRSRFCEHRLPSFTIGWSSIRVEVYSDALHH